MPRPPIPLEQVKDLELLLNAHHPLVVVDTLEEDRANVLLEHLASGLGLPYFDWTPNQGLRRAGQSGMVYGTTRPSSALDYVRAANMEAVFHFRSLADYLDEPPLVSALAGVSQQLSQHRGAIVLTGERTELPASLDRMATRVRLAPPSEQEYYDYARAVLATLRQRMRVEVTITPEEVSALLMQMRGLTFFEVKKVVSQAIVETHCFDGRVIERVRDAKKASIERTGVLEFFPAENMLSDIAGLNNLKSWLATRKLAFREPHRAAEFGLEPPRGLLLLGVQGCGKSLCAKAVSSEWGLPLIRLDPSRLYNKYVGESERNLRRAIEAAEALAPIVLWIDELEKAFASGGGDDGGVSKRVFGTFLTWLQEKQQAVFVIATSNDIEQLPPELLRKGRFDEIFFVDLPSAAERAKILGVHLDRRQRSSSNFDLDKIAAKADGFSGAELEQAVVSALYTAFSTNQPLSTQVLIEEIARTTPLSVTMAEKIDRLRSWASQRAVAAS